MFKYANIIHTTYDLKIGVCYTMLAYDTKPSNLIKDSMILNHTNYLMNNAYGDKMLWLEHRDSCTIKTLKKGS